MIALSRRLPATRSLDALWTVSFLSVRLEENWEKKMQALDQFRDVFCMDRAWESRGLWNGRCCFCDGRECRVDE